MRDFATFAALHVPGDPVVLYNVWDTGSAEAVAEAGAKALATGSHPVGDAAGFGDGQKVPLDFVFANARRILAKVDLPLSVDFEGAYSTDPGEARPDLAGRSDFLGINYYLRATASGLGVPVTPLIPLFDFLPTLSYRTTRNPNGPAWGPSPLTGPTRSRARSSRSPRRPPRQGASSSKPHSSQHRRKVRAQPRA